MCISVKSLFGLHICMMLKLQIYDVKQHYKKSHILEQLHWSILMWTVIFFVCLFTIKWQCKSSLRKIYRKILNVLFKIGEFIFHVQVTFQKWLNFVVDKCLINLYKLPKSLSAVSALTTGVNCVAESVFYMLLVCFKF